MKEALISVYLKQDKGVQSLTKIAISQIILKIIYSHNNNGSNLSYLKREFERITEVKITDTSLQEILGILINSDKINKGKSGIYLIHQSYLPIIELAVKESEELFENVFLYYFSKCDTDLNELREWFKNTLIGFFENHSSEWINELRKKNNGKKKAPNIIETINKTIKSSKIKTEDIDFLKKQFILFLESLRSEDHLLIWRYSTSMFSSKLISLQNYADKISIDFIRNTKIILDTNILMILDLEAYELSSSLKILDKVLSSLNVEVGYLSISEDEFNSAMNYRKGESINTFKKFKKNVIRKADCPFIKTALLRQCETENEIEAFFKTISSIPTYFSESRNLKLIKFDSEAIRQILIDSQSDEKIKKNINEINYRLKRKHKDEKKLIHDTALIKCVNELPNSSNYRILTRDSTLIQYSKEYSKRDDAPNTVSIELLIQLLAINNGGNEFEPEQFAPLMANLINHSILPERDIFQIEDLAILLRTENHFNELPDDRIVELAKEVKRMRFSGESDESISIYLKRQYESDYNSLLSDLESEQSEKLTLKKEFDSSEIKANKLKSKVIDQKIKDDTRKLKITIIKNWLLFFLGLSILIFSGYSIVKHFQLTDNLSNLIINIAVETFLSILFSAFVWKPKLYISSNDKEIIKVNAENYAEN